MERDQVLGIAGGVNSKHHNTTFISETNVETSYKHRPILKRIADENKLHLIDNYIRWMMDDYG
jgi:hypothetical protein